MEAKRHERVRGYFSPCDKRRDSTWLLPHSSTEARMTVTSTDPYVDQVTLDWLVYLVNPGRPG